MASNRKFEKFSGKYTKTGHAGQWLLNNIYGAVASLISNADLHAGVELEVGAGRGYSTSYLRDALHKNVTLLASGIEKWPQKTEQPDKWISSLN